MVTASTTSAADVQQVLRTCAALLRVGQQAPPQQESEQTIKDLHCAYELMVRELTEGRRLFPETANAIAEGKGQIEISYLVPRSREAWHFRAMGWARVLRPIAVQYLDQINDANPWAVAAVIGRSPQ
ncbi:hypothetical protein ABT160_32980 [Streptomyces sp. NPDC001941]|uniref:hypothetical protein n=1 Tax=Streptomyces sp. NPDC001941 TaxID=3154659 RepID=UPI00331DAFDF